MRDASLVAGLKCSGCERTLVEDGYLKCTRCDALVEATLGKKRIFCPSCSNPRVMLARHDEALCPESKKRCSNRREDKGTPMKLTTKEQEMTQDNVAGKAPSKTKELRDWLDAEIKRESKDYLLLFAALSERKLYGLSSGLSWDEVGNLVGLKIWTIICSSIDPRNRIKTMQQGEIRYSGQISKQKEKAMQEDRMELERLKKRLELLRSARELDADVDAMEKELSCGRDMHSPYLPWKLNVYYSDVLYRHHPNSLPIIEARSGTGSARFKIFLLTRTVKIEISGKGFPGESRKFENVSILPGLQEIKIPGNISPPYSLRLVFPYGQLSVSEMKIEMLASA